MITLKELFFGSAAFCGIGAISGLGYLIRGKRQNRFFGAATAAVLTVVGLLLLWTGFNV